MGLNKNNELNLLVFSNYFKYHFRVWEKILTCFKRPNSKEEKKVLKCFQALFFETIIQNFQSNNFYLELCNDDLVQFNYSTQIVTNRVIARYICALGEAKICTPSERISYLQLETHTKKTLTDMTSQGNCTLKTGHFNDLVCNYLLELILFSAPWNSVP